MTHARLRALGATATASALLVLAACGGDSSSDAGQDTSSGGDSADGAFPVTIKSAHGEAEIEAKPERVVTLGQGSAETAIALGNTPVGTETYAWATEGDGSKNLPWVEDAVKKAGDELPVSVGPGNGENLDMEKIVELEPDVILAPWSGLTKEQFDALSKIAPTVSYPDKAWSINWDEQMTTIGKALGEEDKAEELVGDLETTLAEEGKKHPTYADYTFSYIFTTEDNMGVFLPDEQRVAMVRALGLQVDPMVTTLKETEGTDSSYIGFENADKLKDSDLLFTFYSSPEEKAALMKNKLYASIPAVKKGAIVAGQDGAFVTASSMINPLTVPYALERYVPLIDEAIAQADKS